MNIVKEMDFKFDTLIELIDTFPNEQACITYLEKIIWNGTPVSPFDQTSKVYKCKNGRYKCKNTGKYFNVKTGTIFEGTKINLRDWFLAIWVDASHKGGLSSMQLKRYLKRTQKTTWFMLHRVRTCMECENTGLFNGEVEIDETYVGGKNKNRHANKKIKNSQGRSVKDKIPVFGMLQRDDKRVIARVVEGTTAKDLIPQIMKHIECFATIYSDEWGAYKKLTKYYGYEHKVVKHREGQYVDGEAHTNNIENFWSQLKRAIIGVYRVTSEKYLQLYVDEFVFRRNTMDYTTEQSFVYLLKNTKGYRLKYRELKEAC